MTTLIQRFKTDTISVVRAKTNGVYSDDTGMYENGKAEKFDMNVAVNIAKGRDLERLPEAQRTSGVVIIYSDDKLNTANDNVSKKADCITWRGCEYQIQNVEDRTNTRIPHYKSLAVKVDAGAEDRVVTG